MLGFVLAGVSPAVIIPSLIPLIQAGYGNDRGIHTLVITACSADDVVAISGFGIFLGINFVKDADLLDLILHGPIEILIGMLKLLIKYHYRKLYVQVLVLVLAGDYWLGTYLTRITETGYSSDH